MENYFSTLITGVKDVEELKQRIKSSHLQFKEDDNLIIAYSETNQRTGDAIDDATKSVIVDKATLRPIATQFNKLLYNNEAKTYLLIKDWKNVTIKYCYEGTMILVFYSHNQWYLCTRKCLDARTSFWIRNVSYYDLFMDAIDGRFKLDDLNKNYCYHFILVHHKNKNIVNYCNSTELGVQYKNVALAMTTELGTFKRIDYHINDNIIYPKTVQFNDMKSVEDYLENISTNDKKCGRISTEGFIVEHFENGVLTLLKLQTPIYKYIAGIKPNVSNLDAMFLELYQHDILNEIAPFFTSQCREVTIRIHNAMKTLSSEVLNIYHATRSHKNESLYDCLPASYKCVIYTLHGKFIQKRTKEIEQHKESELGDRKSITVYDVYNCLKNMESYYLRTMFTDRIELLENAKIRNLMYPQCVDAYFQGKLMQ